MENSEKKIKVAVSLPSGEASLGEVIVCFWSKQQKTKRAFRALGMSWSAMIVSVFIPLLHFVLVPSFFIVGIALAFYQLNTDATLQSGQAQCPKCKKEVKIEKSKLKWPIQDLCIACKSTIYLNPSS